MITKWYGLALLLAVTGLPCAATGPKQVPQGSSGGGSGTVTSIQCGTGLSGGTITTTGVCAIVYGTTAGTAAQGNDLRFSANVTGLRKGAGAGGSDTAATAGTDYVAPGAIGTAAAQNIGTSGATIGLLNSSNTESGNDVFSASGAASLPALGMTGTPYASGNGTTNFPLFYYDCAGSTQPTTLSTSGTIWGINTCTGFGGNVLDVRLNGSASIFSISASGRVTSGALTISGGTVSLNAGSSTLVTLGSHIASTGIAPGVSGTGCVSVAGSTDAKGAVATTAATSCTVTFATSFASAPFCVAGSSSTVVPAAVSSVSTTALVLGAATLTGSIYYFCAQ